MTAQPHHAYVSWHLDIKFWITIVGAFVTQAIYLTWLVSANVAKVDARVTQNTETIVALQSWRDKQDEFRSQIDARLAVVDEKLIEQGNVLHRIDERQEKFFSRGYPPLSR